MLLSWIALGFTLALGVTLLLNKRYSNLRLVQLYALGFVALSLLYRFAFYNRSFYLVLVTGQAVLFALAYWEIARKQENKSIHLLLLAAVAAVFVPFLPLELTTKGFLPFFFVDAAIALTLPFVFRSRNPFLLVWGVMSSFAVALDVLEFILPAQHQVLLIMSSLDIWTVILANAGLTAVVLWRPVMEWVYRQLQHSPSFNKSRLSLVEGGAEATDAPAPVIGNMIEFPFMPAGINDASRIDLIEGEISILQPMLESATKMITLNNKPFLTPEEAVFYLDMADETELEEFISRFGIQKLHLSSRKNTWVVRRESLEEIG